MCLSACLLSVCLPLFLPTEDHKLWESTYDRSVRVSVVALLLASLALSLLLLRDLGMPGPASSGGWMQENQFSSDLVSMDTLQM